ncbi:helix-turn-helix domain-containing protein [Caldibacillus debilis]|uniref:helix-turn-helix domain-containing protein n=1 Tax=Caldibacillus debilis TaxID=301148 RepID=UPI000E38DA91|nr:helix-turn-helix transcriptional regulator [Caldibacillus debilis]REJ29259.1 MAG: XRE family transcriptional regulator [Caldibacillus debilis]
MRFGGILKAARQRAGLSQEELAHRLNINQSDVSKFENDKKVPDVLTFIQWIQQTSAQEVMVAFLYGMDGMSMIQNLLPMIGGFISWI